jgi:hypothetical protein
LLYSAATVWLMRSIAGESPAENPRPERNATAWR